MTVRELIEKLKSCDPDAEVQIEQTNDEGPEPVTAAVDSRDGIVILEGELFR